MSLSKPGTDTSEPEVTHIDEHGIWILVKGGEYFLPYVEYPWFREARVSQILNVQLLHDDHLFWEALDVDLSLKILRQPESYPLIYK
jgi:hypothetical protein